MQRSQYFKNKVILITGGSSGIGLALAKTLITYEPKTIIILSHDKNKLQQAVVELTANAKRVVIDSVLADICDVAAITSSAETILKKHGAVDILINNAGFAHYVLFHEMSQEALTQHAQVNFIGAMRVTLAFLPQMRARRMGQIMNITSVAAHMIILPNLVYSAAKHGLLAWSEGLAMELHKDNVVVQALSPGRVKTEFFNHESFKLVPHGAETMLTISLDKVVQTIIHALIKRKKLVFAPAYWRLIAWVLKTFSLICKPLYNLILKKRIEARQQVSETK